MSTKTCDAPNTVWTLQTNKVNQNIHARIYEQSGRGPNNTTETNHLSSYRNFKTKSKMIYQNCTVHQWHDGTVVSWVHTSWRSSKHSSLEINVWCHAFQRGHFYGSSHCLMLRKRELVQKPLPDQLWDATEESHTPTKKPQWDTGCWIQTIFYFSWPGK